MRSVTVVVTGVGGGGLGEQCLKALRHAETNYRIVATDVTSYSVGLHRADEGVVVPHADDPAYMDALLHVCRKHEAQALFPTSEPELKVVSSERDRLEDSGVLVPINSQRVIASCLDKVETFRFLRRHGFAHPAFRRISSTTDLEEFALFPCVIKPSVDAGASAHTYIAQNAAELLSLGKTLLSSTGEFVVQEYVGTPESEYTVGVLSDLEGEFVNSIAVKRDILGGLSNRVRVENRTVRRDLGDVLALSSGISQGKIGAFPEVTGPCEKIAEALGSSGPLNIQCRYVNGEVLVLEINPRYSGTTSLRAMVGFNEPDILVRKHVLGEVIEPRFAYRSGIILRGLTEVFFPSEDPDLV